MDDDMIILALGLFAIVWNAVFLWFVFEGKLEVEYGFALCLLAAALPIIYFDLKVRK